MTMLMHHMLRAAAGYAAPTPPATDPQFNYVTMLLHGDGTNGAQNNTFVDSSTNNFIITRNGTPTQGSFSPYGDLWSNQFSGSGQYLTAPSNAAFGFGTGDFTIEGSVFLTSYASADSDGFYRSSIISQDQFAPVNSRGWLFYLQGTSTSFTSLNFTGWSGGSATSVSGSFTFALNTWYHVAVVRSSNRIYFYVNGTLINAGGTAFAVTINDSSIAPKIGAAVIHNSLNFNWYLPAYLSNLRVVKGTALYTSNFTPSTTPLTAVSGTSLLTCQSNRFRDASSNNFAITVTGTPSVQRFSPFDPAAEYSTSVIGGSGYFKGSPDYLSSSTGTALNFGTGDFTVEFWSYWSTHAAYAGMVSTSGGIIGQFQVIFNASANSLRLDIGGTQWTPSPTLTANAWTHIAVVRSGTTVTLYFNGVSVATTTNGNSVNASNLRVGADKDTSNYYAGYISNLRTVTGTAVYTANFTPPTAPLTAITNTALLLNTVNAGISDNAMMNDLVTVGNAQISTSVKKYGTGSMYFDGTGDYLTATDTLPFVFGTGDWTVETWVNPSVRQLQRIYDSRPTGNGAYVTIGMNASGNFDYTAMAAIRITGTTVASTGTWYHVAVCRSGTSTRLFVNGVQEGVTYTDSTNYIVAAGRPFIGADSFSAGATPWNGYMDDFRVTKGYARYTGNFTPPTAAFPNN